jgi:hypothetical protein
LRPLRIPIAPSLGTGYNPLRVFLVWSLLHDVRGSALEGDLGSTGLITWEGEPKPGYAAFRALSGK